MARARNTAERALREFQLECKAEGLGLECALAQLALFAMRLYEAHRQDSWQQTMTNLYHCRREGENVIKALKAEYPEMDWASLGKTGEPK